MTDFIGPGAGDLVALLMLVLGLTGPCVGCLALLTGALFHGTRAVLGATRLLRRLV